MKIIQFVPSLRTGGAETLATNYALELKKKGHEVFCLVYDGDYENSPNKETLASSKVQLFFLSELGKWFYKSNNMVYRFVRSCVRKKNIIKTIWNIKPDVIHFHLTPFKLIYFIIKKYPKVHCFYTIHSEVKSIFKDPKNLRFAKKIVKNKKIQMIALHERMKDECSALLNDHTIVCINNGIDLDRFSCSNDRQMIRKSLGMGCNDFVLGHIGSFSTVKNHAYLFRIFKQVLIKREDAWLLLIGDGYLKDKLIGEAKELGIYKRIIWLEKRRDIPELLSSMDVFVFPSYYEGYPLAVIEAQAAGVRCIISDTITPEVLVTDHIKMLSIESSPEVWCEEIINPSTYRPYSGIEKYDIHIVVEKLTKLYCGEHL